MSHGGARCGAGRPAVHVTAESCRRLDVRDLAREGVLVAGERVVWTWRDSKDCTIVAEAHGFAVSHSLAGAARAEQVPILRTQCHFGGTRPWFGCPGCGRRCAVLFLRPMGFACNSCGGLSYMSQREGELARGARARNKAASRLCTGSRRPKGMQHATYNAIVERMDAAERQCITAMHANTARLLPRQALTGT